MKTIGLAVALKNQPREKHEKNFLKYINTEGMPYEKILLKKHYLRIRAILKGKSPPPFELEIQPTSRCNLKCNFCWSRFLGYKRLEDKLNTKKALDRVIDEALNFKKNDFKIEIIKFCGSTGEPLLNPLTLYAIEKIYGKRYLTLFTNSIKLAENKDNKTYLKTLSKVSRLNASLDADSTLCLRESKKSPGNVTLEDILIAMKRIRELSENDISIEASYVITNENYKGVEKFVEKVKRYKAVNSIRFRINLIDRTVSIRHGDEITELLEKAKFHEDAHLKVIAIHTNEEIKEEEFNYFTTRESGLRCFTSRIWSCIGSNGCLYPCGHIVTGGIENYGSILERSFKEIWESQKRKELVENLPILGCTVCSPFSLRANRFLTKISEWPIEEIDEFYHKYIKNE